jgi:putative redox protein
MLEVTVKHSADVKFAIAARQHTLVCDQPLNNGGRDQGMTPPELFLASLGSCAAFYAVAYLRKKGLLREGVEVRAFAEKASAPARLDPIRIEVSVPGELSDADRAGVEDAVHHCLIHNTLLHTPAITIAIHTPATV